ncbi:MAG: glutamate--tRNA ligase [Desulfurococcaceae archaeon]
MSSEKSLLERLREAAYKHALINAVKHGGKADLRAVVSKIAAELPEVRKELRNYIDAIKSIVEEVNKLPLEEQLKTVKANWPEALEEKAAEYKKELPQLPGAIEGKVVTRLAPNPDFSLHLGNARPALLSYWYAKAYRGKMILRFEDTDPRIKAPYPDAYESIRRDLKWLGIEWDEEYIQSLRLPLFYGIAKELIKRGGAYVDLCSNTEFKKYRNAGKACPHRDRPVEKQLEEFDKMLEGAYSEGEAVVRVKTDLQHPDLSVRDWVAFRIIDTSKTPHPVTGEKYVVWPTYNFAAAVDDYLMGVTHILRAKEHVTNTVKQKYLYDHMGWKYPETIHFGRLSLEGVILSKSKMKKLISEKGLSSYSDPRLGTIQGLKRRGILRETIWELIKTVGVKPVDAKISLANLYAINRAKVDPIANRYMAVEDPVPLLLSGLKRPVEAQIPIHPSRREYYKYTVEDGSVVYIAKRDFEASRNSVFRLMGLGNFVISGLTERDGRPMYVASLHSLSQEEAKKLNAQIIQWVHSSEAVRAKLYVPEGLELREKILYAERRILGEKVDAIIQLYRVGFARVDKVEPSGEIVLVFAHE